MRRENNRDLETLLEIYEELLSRLEEWQYACGKIGQMQPVINDIRHTVDLGLPGDKSPAITYALKRIADIESDYYAGYV